MGFFKTFKTVFQFLADFSVSDAVWWGGKTLSAKNKKPECRNKNHAFRSSWQQQREAPALELNETVSIKDDGSHFTAGKKSDLSDGRFKKTINVTTWTGKTVSVKADLNRDGEEMMRRLETKTGIPINHQHLVSKGKVLKDHRLLKDY